MKKNAVIVSLIVILVLIVSGISVYATATYYASQITYKNGKTVEQALNELYASKGENNYKEVWFGFASYSGNNCYGQLYNFENSTGTGFEDDIEGQYISETYKEAYHYEIKAKVNGKYEIITGSGTKIRKNCNKDDVVIDFYPSSNDIIIVGFLGNN